MLQLDKRAGQCVLGLLKSLTATAKSRRDGIIYICAHLQSKDQRNADYGQRAAGLNVCNFCESVI